MEKQMQAERNRRAEIPERRGREAVVDSAFRGREKTSRINQAEAVKQTEILRAEGEARAIILNAQAEADAILQVAKAVAQSKTDPATYMLAVKYIETLKEMTKKQRRPHRLHPIRSVLGPLLHRLHQRLVPEIKTVSKINL